MIAQFCHGIVVWSLSSLPFKFKFIIVSRFLLFRKFLKENFQRTKLQVRSLSWHSFNFDVSPYWDLFLFHLIILSLSLSLCCCDSLAVLFAVIWRSYVCFALQHGVSLFELQLFLTNKHDGRDFRFACVCLIIYF